MKMNSFTLISTIAVACILIFNVDSFSMPDCSGGCDKSKCPEIPEKCKCGIYLDYCECCSFCLKCPGDQCNLVANEQCANNTTCKPPPGATAIMRINGPGWCT